MRTFVIGGAGPLGRLVIENFVAAGDTVSVLHRADTKELTAGVKQFVGEYREFEEVARRCDFDLVVDFICATEFDAQVLLRALDLRVSRCIVLSSADVYLAFDVLSGGDKRPPEPTPISETGTLRTTRYPYRSSGLPLYRYYDKVLVENVLLQARFVPITILRMPVIFGGSVGLPLVRQLRKMRMGEPVIMYDQSLIHWRGCWSFIGNVAAAILAVARSEWTAGNIYNVADEESPTYLEWLKELTAITGWKGTLHARSDNGDDASGLAGVVNPKQGWNLNTQKIRRALNFQDPFTWREALEQVVMTYCDFPIVS